MDVKIKQIYDELYNLELQLEKQTFVVKYPGLSISEDILSRIFHSRLKLKTLIEDERLMKYAKENYK